MRTSPSYAVMPCGASRDAQPVVRESTPTEHSLAIDGRVASSTQNQALSALLFLYREVLKLDVPWMDGIVRAKRPDRLPVVLSGTKCSPFSGR